MKNCCASWKRQKNISFVEYFIIDEGLMWGKILEVLARKRCRAWMSG